MFCEYSPVVTLLFSTLSLPCGLLSAIQSPILHCSAEDNFVQYRICPLAYTTAGGEDQYTVKSLLTELCGESFFDVVDLEDYLPWFNAIII